jgi:hypothetical protein
MQLECGDLLFGKMSLSRRSINIPSENNPSLIYVADRKYPLFMCLLMAIMIDDDDE